MRRARRATLALTELTAPSKGIFSRRWCPLEKEKRKELTMNVLVIALDTAALDTAAPVDLPEPEMLVVAPALNSRLRRWLSDEDDARRLAGARASATVERLERRGLHAHGQIGDGDPLQAIADALPVFAADEIVIAGDTSV